MDWLLSIFRIAGASFPVASSFVQLQSEIDSKALRDRVSQLEDPVSHLHDDVPELSQTIYREMKAADSSRLDFSDDFYTKYSRALAVLESKGCIKQQRALGKQCPLGIRLIDPSYIMYMCALEEDGAKMESINKLVDNCPVGEWLDGKTIQKSISLPLPVINAIFQIYEAKNYGLRSKEIGSCKYMGMA
jgi:hypothetical protein